MEKILMLKIISHAITNINIHKYSRTLVLRDNGLQKEHYVDQMIRSVSTN